MLYGKDIKFDIHKLEEQHSSIIQNFNCGNDEIDKYLKYKALGDIENGNSLTKVAIGKDNEIIAYYSINCSAIVMENHNHKYFSPAIEIKMFAVNSKYHKIPYSDDDDDTFATHLLCFIIKEITKITEETCGASSIILYSVPYAKKFYSDIGFEPFEEYMVSNADMYLKGCRPMWFKL